LHHLDLHQPQRFCPPKHKYDQSSAGKGHQQPQHSALSATVVTVDLLLVPSAQQPFHLPQTSSNQQVMKQHDASDRRGALLACWSPLNKPLSLAMP